MLKKYILFLTIGFFAHSSPAFAVLLDGSFSIETVSKNSFSVVLMGGLLILFLSLLAVINKNGSNNFKVVTFALMILVSLGVTFYLAGITVFTNIKSATGGPVHWHADFKIYACGEERLLEKPTGLSNRIGRTDLHEHGEKRIHVEGVVVKKSDVSLSEFFRVIGGELALGKIAFPGTNSSTGGEVFMDGEICKTEEGEASAELQVFLYKTEGKEIRQTKLVDYPNYVLSSESKVPPGDCIIFEFSPDQKEKTDQICDFTNIAINKGEYNYIK